MYLIINGPGGHDTALQLREGRFYGDNMHIEPSDVEEAFNPDGSLKEGKIPSIAEFILYGVTQRMKASVFGATADQNIIPQLIQMLVHNGEKTSRGGKSRPWLTRKSLWYDKENGGIWANSESVPRRKESV